MQCEVVLDMLSLGVCNSEPRVDRWLSGLFAGLFTVSLVAV